MGKDFRIGLVLGVVLVLVGVVWLATRPSLSPEARMRRPLPADRAASTPNDPIPWESLATAPEPTPERSQPIETPTREPDDVPAAPQPQEETVAGASRDEAPPPDSSLPDLTIYERDEPITTTRFHIVREGESLSGIAHQYYGSPNEWRKILEANEEAIPDPNKIRPGVKLIIPK